MTDVDCLLFYSDNEPWRTANFSQQSITVQFECRANWMPILSLFSRVFEREMYENPALLDNNLHVRRAAEMRVSSISYDLHVQTYFFPCSSDS